MGGKKKNTRTRHIPPTIQNQEEYDIKRSFSKLNQYLSSNNYQTLLENEQKKYGPPIDNSCSQESDYHSVTNQVGDTYFRLEDKISALSDKNDAAHNSLRKEFEEKIVKLKTDFEQQIKDKKENRKWIISTIVAFIIAIIGYVVLPYQKSSKNQQEIIRIQTTIDENIKPSIENNSKAIEKNTLEIKSNTEKMIQLQNQHKK